MKIDFNEIKKTLTKAAKKTKETSETVVEIAKLKYKLAELANNIDNKYMEIGKLVYAASDDEDITEQLKALCEDISALKDTKDDMAEKLNDLANKKQCPKCDMKFDKEFDFCPKCGHGFSEE